MYRFDGSTVLVINTDLTYTDTLQTFCTLLSGNRRDAVVSQPLLRQPPAEAERVAYRSSSRSGPWSPRGRLRLLGRSPDARCVRRNWGLHTFRGRVPQVATCERVLTPREVSWVANLARIFFIFHRRTTGERPLELRLAPWNCDSPLSARCAFV